MTDLCRETEGSGHAAQSGELMRFQWASLPSLMGQPGRIFLLWPEEHLKKRTSEVRRCGGVRGGFKSLPGYSVSIRHARRLRSVQCAQWRRGKHTRLPDARCTSSTQLLFPTPPPFHFTLWHPCPSLSSSITSRPPSLSSPLPCPIWRGRDW